MALDTQYRPRNFNDVLGQDAIVTILRRYIVTGRSLHQSYLFAGPFGSGKTTLGRIMARALMCTAPTGVGDPCDTCPSCRSILETGTSLDFVEVDAATNSGKADVQKITEEIQYSTFAGRRRIYLFDEAHQLSKDALDALLKPLEENVPGTQDKRLVCIFCTTEPEKMKATIFSRCAPTFVIQPVAPIDIAKRLAFVCQKEGFEYDEACLQVIAEIVECHIRDALKAVEGVSLLGAINMENVAKYLRLDMNLLFVDVLENLGRDLAKVMVSAKDAMTRSSPSTCYEKLAGTAMLAYQVGLGAAKAPSYYGTGRLEALYKAQQHNLLGFASRFASRLGHPTESALLCDLGALHHGGGAVGTATVIVQQASAPSPVVAPSAADRHAVSSVPPPPVQGGGANIYAGKKAEVPTNRKAVNNGMVTGPKPVAVKGQEIAEIDPTMFAFLLALQVANFEGADTRGSKGRTNLGHT